MNTPVYRLHPQCPNCLCEFTSPHVVWATGGIPREKLLQSISVVCTYCKDGVAYSVKFYEEAK